MQPSEISGNCYCSVVAVVDVVADDDVVALFCFFFVCLIFFGDRSR